MTLREYSETTGESQKDLAEKFGLSVPMVCLLLQGKRTPSLIVASRIYEATGGKVTFQDLLPRKDAAA